MSGLTIVIPCYNEAARLDADAFAHYVTAHEDVRFLFVNDGSTDSTDEVLRALCARNPDQLDSIALEKNSGKAEAVRQGMLRAFDQSANVIAYWDADLSTALDEVDSFRAILAERPQTDMVFGSRVNLLGRSIQRKLLRHYLGRIFATIAAWSLKLAIYDTQCGAKMFRATDELHALIQQPFLSKWIFDVELIARFILDRRGSDLPPVEDIIYEQPLKAWYDVAGSKLRMRHFFIVLMDFLRIYRRYLRPGVMPRRHIEPSLHD